MTESCRHTKRLKIDSLRFPFLGERIEGYENFQYRLMKVSFGEIRICIPRWTASHEEVRPNDRMDLHLPFQLGDRLLQIGSVTSVGWDGWEEMQLVIALNAVSKQRYPIYINVSEREIEIDLAAFTSFNSLLESVIKDSILIKRGIFIYLKHFRALFFRFSGLNRKEYTIFRESVINNVRGSIQIQLDYLEALWTKMKRGKELFSEHLDLDKLQMAMKPELCLDMFTPVLDSETIDMYILPIKEIEKKLLSNYNIVVMIVSLNCNN